MGRAGRSENIKALNMILGVQGDLSTLFSEQKIHTRCVIFSLYCPKNFTTRTLWEVEDRVVFRRARFVGWVDILLDVIGGVKSALREGCPRTMTGVSQCWFSGHFRQVFFKHQCIAAHYNWRRRVGRIEHHDRCLLTLVFVYFVHRICVIVYV
jgi:hypothetical protein